MIDTAGRLQIDETLMEELRRLKQQVKPQEILFVVDAMTGQEAVNVAKTFDEKLGIDGVILTKLDGDTRGGAALSIKAVVGKPIKFSGTGEKLADIEPFHPDRMNRLHPEKRVRILNSVGYGVYLRVQGEDITHETVRALETEMRRLAADDLPFQKEAWSRDEAIRYFSEHTHPDKADILAYRPGKTITMRTQSVRGEKWSINRICTVKATAHSNSSTSPAPMESVSVTHSRKSPAVHRPTASHTIRRTGRRNSSPLNGTSTIYSAVTNPALPAEVSLMPNCCRLVPKNSATPQQIPPSSSVRRCAGVICRKVRPAFSA